MRKARAVFCGLAEFFLQYFFYAVLWKVPKRGELTAGESRCYPFHQATMILRLGFETFDFQTGQQKQRDVDTLTFGSQSDALRWLKQVGVLHSIHMRQVRSFVARYWADPETYRVTDHAVLERLATLLYNRRIVIMTDLQLTSSGEPAAESEPASPAFPLSERTQKTASNSSTPPPTNDPATFSPNSDAAAQAAALVAAAANGTPFCAECAKS